MSIKNTVQRLIGGSSDTVEESSTEEDESPSHVCRSCGETYYTDPDFEIETCRSCGGIKVEPR